MDSETWNRRYTERELVWTAEPNRFLVVETEPLAPGRVLDLACGEGRNALWLAARGWRVTGVDFAEVAIEKASAIAQARGVHADWVVADLREYAPAPRAFELVLLFYLQVPAPERQAIVRAAAAGVAPGGTFLLVGHERANIEHGHGGPRDPAVLYTAQDVLGDLAGSGLRIERAEHVERPVQTPEGARVALDVLVRARRDGDVTSAPAAPSA